VWVAFVKRCQTLKEFNFPPRYISLPQHLFSFGYPNDISLFGPKRDEVTGEWRTLQNEDLHDLNSSPTIARVIKSRRMGWEKHIARVGKGRGVYRVLMAKPEGKNHWREPGVDGRIILR
jgi:hypothetical protein